MIQSRQIHNFTYSHWKTIITLIISLLALLVSIYSIYQSRSESVLSNRAYVGPVFWNTSDDNSQFQIGFANSGKTPALNFEAFGSVMINDIDVKTQLLADNQVLLPGLINFLNPKLAFNFSVEDAEKILSNKDSYIQVKFMYIDYVNNLHVQITNFGLHKIDGKYQIQPIKQTIIK